MAKKEPGLIQIGSHTSPVAPSVSGLAPPVTSLLRNGRPSTRDEEYIGDKLRTQLALQIAAAVKAEHGARLAQTLNLRSLSHFDEYLSAERELRDKPRAHADDQADLEQFANVVRQASANGLLAIRQAAVTSIEEVVLADLTPPPEKEQVVVEHTPGFLGRLFGGQQVTTVKR